MSLATSVFNMWDDAQMTSAALGGEGGGSKSDKRKGGCMDLVLTRGRRGSKIPKILLTSFVNGPFAASRQTQRRVSVTRSLLPLVLCPPLAILAKLPPTRESYASSLWSEKLDLASSLPFLLLSADGRTSQRSRTRKHVGSFLLTKYTGFMSQIGTKLRDWAVGQAGAGCSTVLK